MFQKTILLLILTASCIGILSTSYAASDKNATNKKSLEDQATATGFLQEITEIRVHHGPDRSGKEVYEFRCKGCHAKNTQGAPMPDDNFD